LTLAAAPHELTGLLLQLPVLLLLPHQWLLLFQVAPPLLLTRQRLTV
jgi:hypothetical protein